MYVNRVLKTECLCFENRLEWDNVFCWYIPIAFVFASTLVLCVFYTILTTFIKSQTLFSIQSNSARRTVVQKNIINGVCWFWAFDYVSSLLANIDFDFVDIFPLSTLHPTIFDSQNRRLGFFLPQITSKQHNCSRYRDFLCVIKSSKFNYKKKHIDDELFIILLIDIR